MDGRRQTSDAEQLLRQARDKVERLVDAGVDCAASTVLGEFATLASDPEATIEILYAEFLALESAGRLPESNVWLDRYPTHRTRLERLLKLHDFLSAEPAASHPNMVGDSGLDRIPERDVAEQPFPKYELLEEVGRGGMGIVYRARQQGLGRIVALKVLRSMDSQAKVRQRFQQEAEAVASLQHPNIVQVIEISLEKGSEFLSMEFLGGGSLESRLENQRWTNHEIAELIRTLATAVQYAHDRGIIHRDLKPANILFTADQVPKIVDFGLAKKIHDDLNATVTGAVLGTPCYMSPEQAAGDDQPVGCGTDIYSLGVILYQVLTKRLPFEGKTALETLRWIVDRDCEKPSRTNPSIPRDLETICLKCLAKAPQARYASARELADDLERFLDHQPIRARRSGWIEGLQRRIKRHPQVTALVASVALVSIGAATVFYYQNRTVDQLERENAQHTKSEAKLRERVSRVEDAYEANLKKARDSVKEWTQLGMRLDSEPGMDGLRRKAFEDAVAHYRECISANQVDHAIRIEAAVAAIRAAHFHADLGEYATSESELQLAQTWLQPLPNDRQVQWHHADVQILLANILRRVDRWEESQQAYENAIKIMGDLLAIDPNNTGYLIRQSNALVNLCVVYKQQAKWDSSLTTYARAIRLSTKAAAIRAKQSVPEFLMVDGPVDLADVSTALDQVTAYLDQLCKQLQTTNPSVLASLAKENYLPEIALCLDDAGQVFEVQAQVSQAEKSYRDAIRIRELSRNLARENRRVDQFLARSQTNLGKLLLATDCFSEARASLHAADQIYSQLVSDFPDRADCRTEWSHCLMSLSRCHSSQQDWGPAATNAGQAVDQLQYVFRQANSLAVRDGLANYMMTYSHLLRRTGEEDLAEQQFQQAKELAKDRFGPCNSHAWHLALEDSLTESDQAIALELSETSSRLAPHLGYIWNTRALVLARAKRWNESLSAIEQAIQLGQGGVPSDWYIKSMALAGKGDLEGARKWYAMAESARISRSPNHVELRQQARLAGSLLFAQP